MIPILRGFSATIYNYLLQFPGSLINPRTFLSINDFVRKVYHFLSLKELFDRACVWRGCSDFRITGLFGTKFLTREIIILRKRNLCLKQIQNGEFPTSPPIR